MNKVKKVVIEAFEMEGNEDKVTPNAEFEYLSTDSLDYAIFIMELQAEFGLDISYDEIMEEKWKTVQDAYDYIIEHLKENTNQ